MSTDNYIYISRKRFTVVERCASDGRVIAKLGKGNNIGDAIDIAQIRVDEGNVEYGILFGK
ncbi:hypothetical protein HYV64_02845 [Candidatus Shapirobacteria bacterium]|nr:hypothetical protein [Candidatus Shapirobacteria bacterium]